MQQTLLQPPGPDPFQQQASLCCTFLACSEAFLSVKSRLYLQEQQATRDTERERQGASLHQRVGCSHHLAENEPASGKLDDDAAAMSIELLNCPYSAHTDIANSCRQEQPSAKCVLWVRDHVSLAGMHLGMSILKCLVYNAEQSYNRLCACRWVFDLNPDLPWSEVSRETKLRLRSLPKEAVSTQ